MFQKISGLMLTIKLIIKLMFSADKDKTMKDEINKMTKADLYNATIFNLDYLIKSGGK